MKREYNYEQIINQRLNNLAAPDVSGLWQQMETILDREMPLQQETKRRVGAWWMNRNLWMATGVVLLSGTILAISQLTAQPTLVTPSVAAVAQSETITPAESAPLPVISTANGEENNAALKKRNPENAAIAPLVQKAANRNADKSNLPAVSTTATAMFSVTAAKEATEANRELQAIEASNPVLTTSPIGKVDLIANEVPAIFTQQPVGKLAVPVVALPAKKQRTYTEKGVTAGFAMQAPVAMGSQQRNELDMQGANNNLQDYVPAVFAQLHLSKKLYVQAEFQPITAQYTPNFTLYNRTDVLNPDEKEQKVVKLNKLFYTSLPVSVHYNTPLKNVTVGVGMQYSRLRKIILQDQEYYHLIQAGGGFKVDERKNEVVVKDPEAVRKEHQAGDVVDSVARSFRREDWRLLADVGYHYKGFNLGVRYTKSVNDYVNTNFTNLPVKGRNESLQVYLRYNLFDSRKK